MTDIPTPERDDALDRLDPASRALEDYKYELNRELEQFKAEFNRETEGYKYELNCQLESYKETMLRQREHWRLNMDTGGRAAIALASLAIRSLIFANGAAVLALLTFLGHLWGKEPAIASLLSEAVAPGISFFLGGIIAGLTCAGTSYLAQIWYNETPSEEGKADSRRAAIMRKISISLCVLSIGLFLAGAQRALGGLIAPSPTPDAAKVETRGAVPATPNLNEALRERLKQYAR